MQNIRANTFVKRYGFFFICEHVCMCLFMCVHVCVFADMHMDTNVCGYQTSDVFFRHHPSCVLRHDLLLSGNRTSRTDWQADQTQGSTSLCLPSAWITSACHRTWLFSLWILSIKLRSLCLHGKHFINWYKHQSAPVENDYFQLGKDSVVSTSCSSLQIFVQKLVESPES